LGPGLGEVGHSGLKVLYFMTLQKIPTPQAKKFCHVFWALEQLFTAFDARVSTLAQRHVLSSIFGVKSPHSTGCQSVK